MRENVLMYISGYNRIGNADPAAQQALNKYLATDQVNYIMLLELGEMFRSGTEDQKLINAFGTFKVRDMVNQYTQLANNYKNRQALVAAEAGETARTGIINDAYKTLADTFARGMNWLNSINGYRAQIGTALLLPIALIAAVATGSKAFYRNLTAQAETDQKVLIRLAELHAEAGTLDEFTNNYLNQRGKQQSIFDKLTKAGTNIVLLGLLGLGLYFGAPYIKKLFK